MTPKKVKKATKAATAGADECKKVAVFDPAGCPLSATITSGQVGATSSTPTTTPSSLSNPAVRLPLHQLLHRHRSAALFRIR